MFAVFFLFGFPQILKAARHTPSAQSSYSLITVLGDSFTAACSEAKITYQHNNKKEITTYNNDPDLMPLEMLENGLHIRIPAAHPNTFHPRTYASLLFVTTVNWSESIKYVVSHKYDISSLSMTTTVRETYIGL